MHSQIGLTVIFTDTKGSRTSLFYRNLLQNLLKVGHLNVNRWYKTLFARWSHKINYICTVELIWAQYLLSHRVRKKVLFRKSWEMTKTIQSQFAIVTFFYSSTFQPKNNGLPQNVLSQADEFLVGASPNLHTHWIR